MGKITRQKNLGQVYCAVDVVIERFLVQMHMIVIYILERQLLEHGIIFYLTITQCLKSTRWGQTSTMSIQFRYGSLHSLLDRFQKYWRKDFVHGNSYNNPSSLLIRDHHLGAKNGLGVIPREKLHTQFFHVVNLTDIAIRM